MTDLAAFHPAIQRAVVRHQEFFAGQRPYLLKIHIPVACADLEPAVPFDGLDWERDFDAYVRVNVANGTKQARARLDLAVDDDTIPAYHPYFGISIHHAFFGGTVTFGGGTSYAAPVISRAADWAQLNPDPTNVWLQRLARGLAYARDHGAGVLLASYRGGNGPMDMANGVLGDNLYYELYEDPENVHKLIDACWRATLLTFGVQRQHCTEIAGGHVVPGGVWLPGDNIGHLSVDASALISPDLYDEFEKPYLEQITARTGGYFLHTHMLGRHSFHHICRTRGILVNAPVDDPKQPALLDELDTVLVDCGDVPLMLGLKRERLAEDLPKFRGRRAIFSIAATDREDARAIMEEVDRYCPLAR